MKPIHSTAEAKHASHSGRGSRACSPLSPLPVTVTYESLPIHRCWSQKATIVSPSSTTASAAARPGSCWAPAIAKKIFVDSTS